MRIRALIVLALAASLTWAAPLAGLALAGRDLAGYLAFPPRTEYVLHPSFAWGVFVPLTFPVAGVLALYWFALARARPEPMPPVPVRCRFPWWGWAGLGVLVLGWVLAWSDDAVPAGWRRYTFTPIWLGYIVAVNALVYRRTRRSLLTHRAGWFVALFPASALFWWLFEHLNQFVDNWYYSGLGALSDGDYVLQATLPFATVLPAVASTWSWLRLAPRLEAVSLPAVRGHASFAWLAISAGIAALAGIGLWPEALFSMLWLAPLLLLCGLQQLLIGDTFLAPLRQGDWRPLLQPVLAALLCGVLWEMWNFGSAARWHYSVPYVQRFHLFEMPLLGYAGYLPFGLECAVVMDLVARVVGRRALWPLDPGDPAPGASRPGRTPSP